MKAIERNVQPLEFLKLLAHDIRWRVLQALSHSDYRVEELVEQIRQPHNLVSYHLKRLKLKRLVSERRSSADGRDIYYTLNLQQFRQLYVEAGRSVHPAMGEASSQPDAMTETSQQLPVRVLFLCTHNSARSQMAEALLRQLGSGLVEVFSAGSEPASIHPLAIKVMSRSGIDLSQHKSKHLNEFIGQNFDYVVTVCDRVRESCPVFPGDPEQIHWSIPDPAAIEGKLETRERGFLNVSNELRTRIEFLVLVIKHDLEEKK